MLFSTQSHAGGVRWGLMWVGGGIGGGGRGNVTRAGSDGGAGMEQLGRTIEYWEIR